MPADFAAILYALKPVFEKHADRLTVCNDSRMGYMLNTKSPSPFPQHKGEPMFFGAVRVGKAYVSFHLMPLYMCPELTAGMSTELRKRMQGKTCFNFKTQPPPALIAELDVLTDRSIEQWADREWL